MSDFESPEEPMSAMDAYRLLRAAFTTQGDQFEGYVASLLEKVSDEQFVTLVNDVRELQFHKLNPQFVRACITLQLNAESHRRLDTLRRKIEASGMDPESDEPPSDAG
jgi:hypothetical protein